jgi:hypothetical protein
MTPNPVMLYDGFHEWAELDPGDVLVMRLDDEPPADPPADD